MPSKKPTHANTQFPIRQRATIFGLHMMLDGYEADPEKLSDMRLVFKFLNELPDLIGMNKLTAPMIIDCEETNAGKDPGGISGIVIIAESHISIHTFADKGFFTFDMYSCNNFSEFTDVVLKKIKDTFGHTHQELQMVTRGSIYAVE